MATRAWWCVAAVCTISTGCPGAGSGGYEPASELEAKVLARASRDVRMADVGRTEAAGTVVWAGIVRTVRAEDTDSGRPVLELEVEHRHFDWVADAGLQPERYFLSPLGEGNFRTRWQLPRVVSAAEVLANMTPKDMVVVYGHPRVVDAGGVEMATTEYIRLIPAKLWRDDVFEYGPGLETRHLRTPGPTPQPHGEK